MAYGFAESPFGRLLVALTKRGVVRVAYPDHQVDEELKELAAAVSPRILESRTATSEIRRELETGEPSAVHTSRRAWLDAAP